MKRNVNIISSPQKLRNVIVHIMRNHIRVTNQIVRFIMVGEGDNYG